MLIAALLGGWFLATIWLAAAILFAIEWASMTRLRPTMPMLAVMIAGLSLLQLAFASGWTALALIIAALSAAALAAFPQHDRDRLWGVAGFGCAAAIALVPIALRSIGLTAILWLFAVVWATDVAAYFVGRLLGGLKLWPAVSPHKTWSGFAGGLLGGSAVGLATVLIGSHGGADLSSSGPAILLVSALASLASQAGDLGESAMKRHFGVKDSGQIIPGHGGAMDRLDGFTAVAVLTGFVLLVMHPAVRTMTP